MGPMFASNQTASAISTMGSLLVTAQTTARAYGTPVALRIERAYKTNGARLMVNAQGETPYPKIKRAKDLYGFTPAWLDHQQVRMLVFAPGKLDGDALQAFQTAPDSFAPVALPKDIWLAPGERFASLQEGDLMHTPGDDKLPGDGVRYNAFENFMVVFNASGELVRHPGDKCYYLDRTQRFTVNHDQYNWVDYPPGRDSSLSLIAYDRSKWNSIDPSNGSARYDLLQRTAVPIYINRFTGAVLEGKR